MHIYNLKPKSKLVIESAIPDHIFKKQDGFCVQKVAFLDNFERMHRNAFTVGKCFRQIDKNSSDGNDKKCSSIRILVAKIWWLTQLPNRNV